MDINSSFSHRNQEPENSILYMVGTPIGNLDDISQRVLKILKNVSYIACEDTRQTNKIMGKFKFKNQLISFNKHNAQKRIPKIINDLKVGKSVALVSDAGLPSICDPGEDLVKNAISNSLDIICVPGPSAVLTALVASGMNASSFVFEGFLPRKNIERKKILSEISQNIKTTVLFESPQRLNKLLMELKESCGGEREIHISRELTKMFEENIRGSITKMIEHFKGKKIMGEITVVIEGIKKPSETEIDETYLKQDLLDLINAGLSLSAASKYLAKKNNLSKNLIYNILN